MKRRVKTPDSGLSPHTKNIIEQNKIALKKLSELNQQLKK
ncbi:hypothetical protein bcgnr5373_57210 [Bacillus cereus]